jgi:tRNA pseudouridine38-40 synthase
MQRPVKVVGAGRTDTGVHSRGQAAHFDSSTKIENTSQFEHTFNRMLPSDVKIAGLQEAPRSNLEDEEGREYQWHAIYNAVGKLYIYRFYSGPVMDPLDRHVRHFEYRGIDHEKLLLAARAFEGTHSFAAFANQNTKGKAGKNAVRTIHSINVVDEGEGRYRLEFLLDGALYKMVRLLVQSFPAMH